MVAWAGIERLRLGWQRRARCRRPAAMAAGGAGSRCDHELSPRLPCRQFRRLLQACAAGRAARYLRAQAGAVFRAGYPCGAGWYDLDAEPSRRTGEAERRDPAIAAVHLPRLWPDILALVDAAGALPGSPALIRARAARRTTAWHAVNCIRRKRRSLSRRFHRDTQVEVHERSGWEALGALLPPREKRGLVFIDPPFEARTSSRGWRTGCSAATRGSVMAFSRLVSDQADGGGSRVSCRCSASSGNPRHHRGGASPAGHDQSGPAQWMRPAGHQSALPVRGAGWRDCRRRAAKGLVAAKPGPAPAVIRLADE